MKPKLLVIELWGLGDLVIATPFLQAASERFEITLVAKPYAADLQTRFWPNVNVIPFVAPWTAFRGKYNLHHWPWRELFALRRRLSAERFDIGLSARWDPRDHMLLALARAKCRIGFPRMLSQFFLTDPLTKPHPLAHRYEYWRALAEPLGVGTPSQKQLHHQRANADGPVLIHTGAGQTLRVWPLERFRALAQSLRREGHTVRIACDRDQRPWWMQAGEVAVSSPRTVGELMELIEQAAVFIGNDSGPGHLAAWCGVPTLTVFGPQLPQWFAPLNQASEWIDGKECRHKPCLDYCHFAEPHCILGVTEEEVLTRALRFLSKHIEPERSPT